MRIARLIYWTHVNNFKNQRFNPLGYVGQFVAVNLAVSLIESPKSATFINPVENLWFNNEKENNIESNMKK